MKSVKHGKSTSDVEVQGVSQFGVWLFVGTEEFFLPYEEYPWFKDATIAEVMNVRLVNEDHLEWPDLDVDLELASLKSPEKYPLKFKSK